MSNMTIPAISIDGKDFQKEDAKVSIFDHGFLYGDGVFEGMRIYGDRIFRAERHMTRLFRSAKVIDLQFHWTKQEIIDEIRRQAQNWSNANQINLKDNENPLYVRVIMSRGDGDLGLDPKKCPKSKLVIIVDRIQLYPQEHYEKGLTLVTTAIKRNLPDSLPPQVKSLNYLCNIMAKLDSNRQNAAEAIFLNHMGYVSEATADNIFIVRDNVLITPPTSDGALPGITREVVLELAKKNGIPNREWHIPLADLYSAEECFVTGTAAKVVPVTKIDGRSIGEGTPGPITRQLMDAFIEQTKVDGVCVYDEVCA